MADFNLSNLTVKRPLRVTTYTTGSGTFTPLVSNGIARVTLVGGGGAGGGYSGTTNNRRGAGGGGGETLSLWMRLSEASYAYAVGAGGTGGTGTGTDGGVTTFGTLAASPGIGGYSYDATGETYGPSGGGGKMLFSYATVQGNMCGAYSVPGGRGGRGNAAAPAGDGMAAGNPFRTNNYDLTGYLNHWPSSGTGGSGVGGGGGGSLYGKGGNGGANGVGGSDGSAGTGYGAGGGGAASGSSSATSHNGGNGSGGLIIIEEWGAP